MGWKTIFVAPMNSSTTVWSIAPEAVYERLETSPQGLSGEEAARRLQRYGLNELAEPVQRPLWLRFVDQMTHFMALLLWVAGILAFVSGTPQLGWAIWAVIWINGLFSFSQEFRAEKALATLKKVLPAQVKVYRDGTLQSVLARELVRGDVVQLEEGDRVSADLRLVSADSLYVDVSVMTGESLPVARFAESAQIREVVPKRGGQVLVHGGERALQDPVKAQEIRNLVLAGSTIATGRGVGVVYATGAETEFGHMAHLTTNVKREPSTLEVQISQIVRVITLIAVGMGVLVFVLASLVTHLELKESFIFAIGIIVALVPEGLLPTVTLSLAMGVQRMAKRNALVRRLSAVETLSATTVICTDKTGTLTKNEMTVRSLWIPATNHGQTLTVPGEGYDPSTGKITFPPGKDEKQQVKLLLIGSALCSNAHLIHPSGSSRWQEMGDPTEAALLVAALKADFDLEQLQQDYPRRREVPFDSRRRMMTVVLDWQKAGENLPFLTSGRNDLPWENLAFTKGAPLEVLRCCQSILKAGQVTELTSGDRQIITEANDHYAKEGFRVLGLAVRADHENLLEASPQTLEQQLIFVGLVAMFDPPRPEVPEAIARCHGAGIAITMVTGDYGLTAEAIARSIGLVKEKVRVVTGDGLTHLSDAQLRQILKYRSGLIFARMAPEQKLRLVQAYQGLGQIVAVTGDGVNDAPALRAANIGIAMGLNGTDVAREAADIVLTDDNFATIVSAVEEGRTVYQNIRKFITYILASNVAELVPFLAMIFLNIPPALLIMQILAIDLGTDMVPALALGIEKAEVGTMKLPPRQKNQALLDRALLLRAYCFLGIIEAGLGMAGFFLVWGSYGYGLAELQAVTTSILHHTADPILMAIYAQATTMTLAVIVACQDGNVFACRSERTSAFKLGWFSNPLIWIGIATEWMLILSLMYFPSLQAIFTTTPLTNWQFALLLSCPPLLLGAEELRKFKFL
ncbi:Zinc exporter [Synechocystis sp. PCC 6803]|uniref:Zinc exporter n=2 Tax=Synechocystis TaxID=1142 RepID=P73273_SYNY3|nr:cation-transporting P-type ATPase [Synechocystis sp. PCC 6803]AVP88876.1 HAD family hydrolase [Synechocystis sp. IPPAS B-1465]MBD2617394.1 cation-transporting P-type ATPase [Synechocystis sp. FACHB-898]MBD2639826.1 cation-transporting P-type ATPase [Synechocystis sp. FACHB-908]MBD2659883.1 cation-transporting P-type ATPase [Synechocystis sp. FACHB-929]BAL28473.1 Zinc exporter [Synechocystis sp. PCC 6803 substr. GT-I]BAL31642.1 Zinc exporter [Synechocystis sp. PCC 6803 substr. PCC-N]BAL348